MYRVVGLTAHGGLLQGFPAPAFIGLLKRLVPLPSGLGFDPGGKAVVRSALFGLVERRRIPSPSVELVALQPVHFDLAVDGSSLSVR